MNNIMQEHEKVALQNTIKAMSPEEQAIVLETINDTDLLWEELRRREKEAREFKKRMEDFVYNR